VKPIVTSLEMKLLDSLVSKKFAMPLVLLMENAGAEVARYIVGYLSKNKISNPNILIVAGPGNNGGDGIVTTRHLLNAFDKISILLSILRKHPYQGDTRINYEIVKRIAKTDGRIKIIENKLNTPTGFKPDIAIDAIFGTGFQGAPQGIYKKVIELINQTSAYKIAIDIPSGINGNSGAVEGSAVKADLTITMGLIKRGHLLYPGKSHCGEVKVVNLGVPYEKLIKTNTFLLDQQFISETLPKRRPDGHKGIFGSVLVVAGGKGYSGAACLTSLGAIVTGAGLVRLCFPENINTAVEKKLTEVIKVSLPATIEGTLAVKGYNQIKEIAQNSTVLAIGPGVTTNEETKQLIQKVIGSANLPMVIDADGLNNVTLDFLLRIPKQKRLNVIITPHPGEFSRLISVPVNLINKNRIDIVRDWTKKLSMIIVLKGVPTVIGTPDGNVYVNPTGNSGLAKGGSGDVLTGMIAGFIAQGAKPDIAANLGVYLHGFAADLAVKNTTEYSLVASDLIKTLPNALKLLTH
jgi:NAD(P)H-hydrate epimerase